MKIAISKLVLAVAALGGASMAQAAPYAFLSLTQGASNAACSTQTAASAALCAAAGFINLGGGAIVQGTLDLGFNGTVGDYKVTFTSYTSNAPGTPDGGFLNQSTTSAERKTGLSAASLFIDARALGYTLPAADPLYFSASGGNSSNATKHQTTDLVATVFGLDSTNSGNASGAGVTTLAHNTFGGPSTSPTSDNYDLGPVAAPSPSGTYSLTIQQAFSLAVGSVWNTAANAIAVPEPVTTSLVGLGLLGAALAARRRSTKA